MPIRIHAAAADCDRKTNSRESIEAVIATRTAKAKCIHLQQNRNCWTIFDSLIRTQEFIHETSFFVRWQHFKNALENAVAWPRTRLMHAHTLTLPSDTNHSLYLKLCFLEHISLGPQVGRKYLLFGCFQALWMERKNWIVCTPPAPLRLAVLTCGPICNNL